jgi:4-hydroxy-3-polyprenylbenzoate decarboxylase
MKTALGLMGMSQLSLTKCIVLVSGGVNVRRFDQVLHEIRDHFNPHTDFVLIPRVPLDTLDFTSYTMNLGSKMILDATRKPETGTVRRREENPVDAALRGLPAGDARIVDTALLDEALLLVKTRGQGMPVLQDLVRRPLLRNVAVIAAVSDDVDIHDRENAIWGVFTRFDCERDVIFSEQRLVGISPVYSGVMGIDATWKPGYPRRLEMTEDVRRRVEDRWEQYWK